MGGACSTCGDTSYDSKSRSRVINTIKKRDSLDSEENSGKDSTNFRENLKNFLLASSKLADGDSSTLKSDAVKDLQSLRDNLGNFKIDEGDKGNAETCIDNLKDKIHNYKSGHGHSSVDDATMNATYYHISKFAKTMLNDLGSIQMMKQQKRKKKMILNLVTYF